jgi:hypothetical protein
VAGWPQDTSYDGMDFMNRCVLLLLLLLLLH